MYTPLTVAHTHLPSVQLQLEPAVCFSYRLKLCYPTHPLQPFPWLQALGPVPPPHIYMCPCHTLTRSHPSRLPHPPLPPWLQVLRRGGAAPHLHAGGALLHGPLHAAAARDLPARIQAALLALPQQLCRGMLLWLVMLGKPPESCS